MSALDSFKFTMKRELAGQASVNRLGFDPDQRIIGVKTPIITLSSLIADAAVGGGSAYLSEIIDLDPSGTATIDLTAFTDYMNRSAQAFARIKGFDFHLLSAADDAAIGTAASGVAIGNAGSNPHTLILGGTAPTMTLHSGEWVSWGTNLPAGKVVDGTHKNILLTNLDSVLRARVRVSIPGGIA